MSELVEFLFEFLQESKRSTSSLRIRDVGGFPDAHYGESIKSVPSNWANESYFLCSSSISTNVLAQNIKNQGIMMEEGKMIRDELFNIDFGLQDIFCDKRGLKTSFYKVMMPDCLLAFLYLWLNL